MSAREKAAGVLEAVEWLGANSGGGEGANCGAAIFWCPMCDARDDDGHATDCALFAALTALRAEDAAERDAVEGLLEVAEAYDGESFDAFCAIEAARALWPTKEGT